MNVQLCTLNGIIKRELFFQYRHKVFSERLNWNVTVHNGKEYDQYDNQNAKYIIIYDNYEIIASVRLIETKHPHLLTGSFHEYFSCQSHATIEATRFFVRKQTKYSKDPVCQILFSSMIEYCLYKKHSSIEAIVGIGMRKLLNKYGWTHDIIEDCFIDEKPAYLINLPISSEICINIKRIASLDPEKNFITIHQ
ncbi:acyl-homoserine-lactone synthase [Lonsdalea quercina]|uniref:acyl-homoserine-lactone synthase n=1 Tax=Lonsdalea quercina TaxID=71657 RepID=UPI0039765BBC